MKVIKAGYEILTAINGLEVLKHVERIGRVCYKSEDKITDDGCLAFVKRLIGRGHEAMIEHYSFSVKFICDRGVSHEIVRHRIAAFAQESTRYCNYGAGDVVFIAPCWLNGEEQSFLTQCGPFQYSPDQLEPFALSIPAQRWFESCLLAEFNYQHMLTELWRPEQARSVLPNSLKTEIVMTANLREWRHFFKLRTENAAHPQMREITRPLLSELQGLIPVVFDDIQY